MVNIRLDWSSLNSPKVTCRLVLDTSFTAPVAGESLLIFPWVDPLSVSQTSAHAVTLRVYCIFVYCTAERERVYVFEEDQTEQLVNVCWVSWLNWVSSTRESCGISIGSCRRRPRPDITCYGFPCRIFIYIEWY